MANHSERPIYIFRAASEFAPDAEVMAKKDVERYVHWLNDEHGADIEQTWRRAREYYGKEIESLKAKIRELGGNA